MPSDNELRIMAEIEDEIISLTPNINTASASRHRKKLLKYLEEVNHKYPQDYRFLAKTYYHLAEQEILDRLDCDESNFYDKAIMYLENISAENKIDEDYRLLAKCYEKLGRITHFIDKDNTKEAIFFYTKALVMRDHITVDTEADLEREKEIKRVLSNAYQSLEDCKKPIAVKIKKHLTTFFQSSSEIQRKKEGRVEDSRSPLALNK